MNRSKPFYRRHDRWNNWKKGPAKSNKSNEKTKQTKNVVSEAWGKPAEWEAQRRITTTQEGNCQWPLESASPFKQETRGTDSRRAEGEGTRQEGVGGVNREGGTSPEPTGWELVGKGGVHFLVLTSFCSHPPPNRKGHPSTPRHLDAAANVPRASDFVCSPQWMRGNDEIPSPVTFTRIHLSAPAHQPQPTRKVL